MPRCQAQPTSLCAPLLDIADIGGIPLSDRANLTLCHIVRHSKRCSVPHCQRHQTLLCAPLSDTTDLGSTALSDRTNLALCHTVRHSRPRSVPHCQAQLTSAVPLCQTQQTSLCAPLSHTSHLGSTALSDTTNLALCDTVIHNRPRYVSHCQAQLTSAVPLCQTQQTSLCAPLSDTADLNCTSLSGTAILALCHTQAYQTSPCTPLSDTAMHCAPLTDSKPSPLPHCQTSNLALYLTVRHSKLRPVPHSQAQQSSHHAAL